MESVYCVIDDIQFPEMTVGKGMPGVEKAFGYAAYVIDRPGMEEILTQFRAAKISIGLFEDDPIKATMDQEIARVFHSRHGHVDGAIRFRIAKKNAYAIGCQMMEGLTAAGAKVIATMAWPFSKTPQREDLLRWAFEPLLQRIGFLLKERGCAYGSAIVVVDRPEEAWMYESFREGVFRRRTTSGATYLAGALGDLGVLPALTFSSTPDSPPLQLGDFVARACRDFVTWCQNPRKVPQLFLPIVPALHRSRTGVVDKYGFLIDPTVPFTIDEKIAELTNRARSADI